MRRRKRAATITLHWPLLFLVTPLRTGWVTPGLELTLAIAALIMSALALHGLVTGAGVDMTIHYHVLLWTTFFHAIHHLFRHPVSGDGSPRTMTPRSIHRHP